MTRNFPESAPAPSDDKHGHTCQCITCVTHQLRRLAAEILAEPRHPPTRSLTPQQAADLLQVAVNTVYREIRNGKLPALRLGGKYRLSSTVIEKMLATGETPTD
jgi:excisionase family DNA binding protein